MDLHEAVSSSTLHLGIPFFLYIGVRCQLLSLFYTNTSNFLLYTASTPLAVTMLSQLLLLPLIALPAWAQDGYVGYHLSERGDENSVIYETADTPAAGNVSTTQPPPDVYLNASVSVGEIDIEVQNLTAKINLAAQVLSLLNFNAGVDASIDSVQLLIQNVTAKVVLEARLSNLVIMVGDVLNSLDLNPVLATLGNDVGTIVNATTSAVGSLTSGLTGSGSSLSARDQEVFNLAQNILYAVNDYSGNTHTNRILAQNGDIIEQSLDNNGHVSGQKTVGNYQTDMTFNGYNITTKRNGQEVQELEYNYSPLPGFMAVSAIFVDGTGKVVGTQVLAETQAGGYTTVSGEEKANS